MKLAPKIIRIDFSKLALAALLASCTSARFDDTSTVAQSAEHSCVFIDLFTDQTFEEFASTEAAAAAAAREECEANTGNQACVRVRCSDGSLSARAVPMSTVVCEAADSTATDIGHQAEAPGQNTECQVVEERGHFVKCWVEDVRRDGEIWYGSAASRPEAKQTAMESCLGDAGIECVHRGCIDAVVDDSAP
jgi:hypothetical protein